MARSLNKVQVIGRIQPNDPELKYTASGKAVCTFKVVTDESYKDNNGQTVERAEWHRIVFWGKSGELVAQYMKKGSRIYIEGRLQTRQFEHEGQTRYITEIVGSQFLFLDSRQGEESRDGASASTTSESAASVATGIGAEDDDLPF